MSNPCKYKVFSIFKLTTHCAHRTTQFVYSRNILHKTKLERIVFNNQLQGVKYFHIKTLIYTLKFCRFIQ